MFFSLRHQVPSWIVHVAAGRSFASGYHVMVIMTGVREDDLTTMPCNCSFFFMGLGIGGCTSKNSLPRN